MGRCSFSLSCSCKKATLISCWVLSKLYTSVIPLGWASPSLIPERRHPCHQATCEKGNSQAPPHIWGSDTRRGHGAICVLTRPSGNSRPHSGSKPLLCTCQVTAHTCSLWSHPADPHFHSPGEILEKKKVLQLNLNTDNGLFMLVNKQSPNGTMLLNTRCS